MSESHSAPRLPTLPIRQSLRWRLPLLVAGIVVVVLATFLWAAYIQVENALVEAGSNRAVAGAEQLAGLLATSARQRGTELRRVAGDATLRHYLLDRSEGARRVAETRLRGTTWGGQHVVEIWTRTGERLLAIANPAAAESTLVPGPPPMQAGLRFFRLPSKLVASELTEEIRDPAAGDRTLGHIVVRRPVSTSPTPDALSRLVGGNARVLLGSRTDGSWTDLTAVVSKPPAEPAKLGPARYRADTGEPRLGALSEISGTPWLVWVEFPEAVFLEPARGFLRQMIVIGLGFVLLAAVIGRVVMARVTSPLSQLTAASEAIAAGDYSRRVAADRRDEIGRLGGAFNAMAEQIQEVHQRLETRVQERTAALNALKESEARRKQAEQARLKAVELEAENRRVREANRMKSEFLANMSHELRTPLNAIIGFSSILQSEKLDGGSAEYEEFVGHILTSGQHLLQLINDVLDLSKVEAGKLEFRPEPVDLQRVCDEVLSILKTTAASRQLHIHASIDPAVRHVTVDPARLKQVLYNYVSNAVKFSSDGGRIDVRALAEGPDMFRLEVQDRGIGIAASDLGRLFVEFQQLDAGMAKQHGGTGLGLALTKRLVESQGGSVGVFSTLGEGSVFHAVLPRLQSGAPSADPFTATPRPTSFVRPAILVIEDDFRDRAQIVDVLAGAGYAVEAAVNGSEALEKCRRRAFDAVTLDLLLPDRSGLDVLRQIRHEARNPDAPVIVVTVVAERQALAGHVVSDILSKPLESDALLESLRRAGVQPQSSNRILVVDDDEASVRLLSVTLDRLGHSAEGHTDPRSGLKSAELSPPSAIVLDLLMPELDGFQFIDALRLDSSNRTTPVIVWTVKDLSSAERQRLSESVRNVVRKGHGGVSALLDELHALLPLPDDRS